MKKVFIVLLSFALFGCSVNHMKIVYNKPVTNLSDNQSAIIFIRATSFGFLISSPIAEYKDGNMAFVGNMKGASKMIHITTPGKHDYVVAGENGYVLKADLKGGMYYYVYIVPQMGMWKAQFIFEQSDPLHEKNNLAKYINSSNIEWLENTSAGLEWFDNNKTDFMAKYKRAISANRISSFSKDAGTSSLIK